MKISQKMWAQFGKMMMFIFGLACLIFSLYYKEDNINYFLRMWVGLYGVVSLYLATTSRRI